LRVTHEKTDAAPDLGLPGLGPLIASIGNVEESHPHTPLERGLARILHIVTNIIFLIVAMTLMLFTSTFVARTIDFPRSLFTFGMVFLMIPLGYIGLLAMKMLARYQLFTIIGA
jgi:hypothetical protein